jgi:hypothetical protein
MTYLRHAFALVLSVTVLSACTGDGDGDGDTRAVDPAASDDSSSRPVADGPPTRVPDGPVRTRGLVTVLDSGDGPELCLGPVAESYPPQCGGPALAGFEWGDVGFEEASGVKWGTYAVTGTYDGTTFTATDAIPAALYDAMAEPQEEPLGAACETPGTTDTTKVTPQDLDATLAAASALPGYATAWLTGNTINVAVTDDAEGAEQTLRETWGGPLCVTTVERTDADLNAVNQELQAALGESLLTSGSFAPDSLDAQVVYDDGAIQEWADATYGEGLVRISSALVPVS